MKIRKSSGFTLIELLVVIAIIAILAAILFPVFVRATAIAQQATCLSNMGQLSKAWTMYTDDHGLYPGLVSSDWTRTWMEIMLPYVKGVKTFGCPAGYVPKSREDIKASKWGKLSYGWNTTVFNYPWLFPVKPGDIDRTSRTVFLCDSTAANWISLPGGTHWRYTDESLFGVGSGYVCRPPINRHGGLINCAFVDGHAKAIPYSDLIKDEPGNGRRVVYVDSNYVSHWTNSASKVFSYFAVSANYPKTNNHF